MLDIVLPPSRTFMMKKYLWIIPTLLKDMDDSSVNVMKMPLSFGWVASLRDGDTYCIHRANGMLSVNGAIKSDFCACINVISSLMVIEIAPLFIITEHQLTFIIECPFCPPSITASPTPRSPSRPSCLFPGMTSLFPPLSPHFWLPSLARVSNGVFRIPMAFLAYIWSSN